MRTNSIFWALFLAYSSLTFLGLCDNIRGPLYPEILNTFPVSNTVGSLFFALSSVAGFFGGLMSSKLDQRWGTIVTLRASLFVMLLSQLLMSLSTQFHFLLLSVLVFGVSFGVVGVETNVLVTRSLPPGPLKNKAFSGLHSMYAAASLLAPLAVNFIIYLKFSFPIWRTGFLFSTLFGLVIFALTFGAPRIQESPLREEEIADRPDERWAQIYYAVLVSCYVLCEIMVSSRMALYMRREFHADLSKSSWYTAGFFICLFVGRLIFSIWSPKLNLKNQAMSSLLLSMACLLVGILFHPLGLVFAGFCMGPFYPIMMVSAGHLFPVSVARALGWAVAMSSLFVVGMHLTVGYVTDHWGLQTAFYLGPLFCLISMVMLGFYEKIFRRLQPRF